MLPTRIWFFIAFNANCVRGQFDLNLWGLTIWAYAVNIDLIMDDSENNNDYNDEWDVKHV